MAKKENEKIRQEAETEWAKKEKRPAKPLSEADQQRNIQELQIHQIELEMQQEELRREIEEHQRLEAALNKTEATLRETMGQLKLINDVAVGNELKLIDREKEVDRLLQELGRKEKYGKSKEDKNEG